MKNILGSSVLYINYCTAVATAIATGTAVRHRRHSMPSHSSRYAYSSECDKMDETFNFNYNFEFRKSIDVNDRSIKSDRKRIWNRFFLFN